MNHRRRLIARSAAAAAGWAALGAPPLQAQPQPAADDGLGAPAATSPFSPEVYRDRRRRLMAEMNGGVAVLYAATEIDPTSLAGPGRQNSDFSYLTGLQDEAGAVLVLAPAERTHREFLLLAPRNPENERWAGLRLPLGQSVRQRTGFESLLRTDGLGRLVTALASRAGALHFLGPLAAPNSPVPPALELYGKVTARLPGTRIVNSHDLIRRMRTVKEAGELELIRRAIAATERGLLAAMRQARVGMRERELKGLLEAEFRAGGARGLAFASIVGTGRHSAVLHYTGSDAVIRAGDMLLCDVGAEVGGYAADITRSFPVDGRFSPAQRAVYETVLQAQEAAIRTLKAGVVYEDLEKVARDVMSAAGHRDDYWHGLGHFVGLEVHDAGNYALPLPAGAVVTIEPGIYLPERGFGVRIEDDFLVTADGSEHLSRGVPRAPREIEALMRR